MVQSVADIGRRSGNRFFERFFAASIDRPEAQVAILLHLFPTLPPDERHTVAHRAFEALVRVDDPFYYWLRSLAISRLACAEVPDLQEPLAALESRLAESWSPYVSGLLAEPLVATPYPDVLRAHPGADWLARQDETVRLALVAELEPRVSELLNSVIQNWGGAGPPHKKKAKKEEVLAGPSLNEATMHHIAERISREARGRSASQAAQQPAVPEAEPVDAAVFCPPRVAKESVFLVQVFLYPPAIEATVNEQALRADPAAERRNAISLPLDLPHGTRVDLRLEMPSLSVVEPDAVLVWRSTATAAQFEVEVPATAAGPNVIGRIRFAIGGVPAGTLRFQVTLVPAGTAAEGAELREVQTVRYRQAFVSYSSKDRSEVLKRVQAFKIAGMKVFQDILDLEPGERWARALYREIDSCDVFLLFWSRAAAASEWVAKEIDYALARKQGDENRPPDIQPVPIEGPPIVPGPEKLRHLHFNDALLAQISAAT
jgi:hypothetical protein